MTLVNAVYYPSWRVYKNKSPSCIQGDIVTHVFYAFLRVNEDGSLCNLDHWCDLEKEVDGQKGCLAALAHFKQRHSQIKTLVSVGGGSGSRPFPALAANECTRRVLAKELKDFCDRHEFDGADIDWEHPKTAVEGANFVLLLRDLRWAMPKDSYLLTTALPIGVYCLQHINLSDVGKIVNFLNLMCYDFHGDWTSVSGHHAQLCGPRHDGKSCPPPAEKSCTSGVDYVISRGLPPSKILLGVPVYARYFQQATGPREKFVGAGEMEYNDIPSEWISSAEIDEVAGAASVMDDRDQEGSTDGGGGGGGGKGFVSFDVPATVTMKAKLVKARGLGGLFYWTAAGDRNDGESLVLAGYKELQLSTHRQVNGGW